MSRVLTKQEVMEVVKETVEAIKSGYTGGGYTAFDHDAKKSMLGSMFAYAVFEAMYKAKAEELR